MIELRPYQHDALLALFEYWRQGGGNPLIDLPTGTGKSLVIADLCRRFYSRGRRVLVVSHVREIIEQDVAAIRAVPADQQQRQHGDPARADPRKFLPPR